MTRSVDEAHSFLFLSGLDDRGLREGLDSAAHAVIADWEDLVPDERKAEARATTAAALGASSAVLRLVRVNEPGTAAYDEDVVALRDLAVDAVIVPKCDPYVLRSLADECPPVVALVETGRGVRLAYETLEDPRAIGLAIGPGDLSRDLRIDLRPDGLSLLYTRGKLVVDSAAAGRRSPIDAPSRSMFDEFVADVLTGKSLGFGGKFCLTPDQADLVNQIYASAEVGSRGKTETRAASLADQK